MSDLTWKYLALSTKKTFFFAEIFTEVVLISTFMSYTKFFLYFLKKKPLKNLISSREFNFPEILSLQNSKFLNLRETNFFNDIFKLIIQKFFFMLISSFPFLLIKECDFEYLLICNILNFIRVENHSIRCCSFIFYSSLINSWVNLTKFKDWCIKKKKFSNKIKKLLIFNSSKEVSIFAAINLKKIKSKIDITKSLFFVEQKNNFYSCIPPINLLFNIKNIKKNLNIFHVEERKFSVFNYFKKIFILNYITTFRTFLTERSLNSTLKKNKISNVLQNKNNIRIFKEIVYFIYIKLNLWFLEKKLKSYFTIFFFIPNFFFSGNFFRNYFSLMSETIISPAFSFNNLVKIFGMAELLITTLSNLGFHFKIKKILQLLSMRVKIKSMKFKKKRAFFTTFLNKFLLCLFSSSLMVYKKIRPVFKGFEMPLVFRVLVLNKKIVLNSTNKPIFNKLDVKVSHYKISRFLKKMPIQFLPDFYLKFLKFFIVSEANFKKKFIGGFFISKNELLKSLVSFLFLIFKQTKTLECPTSLLVACFDIIKSYQSTSFLHLIFNNKIPERFSKKYLLKNQLKNILNLNIFYRTQKISLKVYIISIRNRLYNVTRHDMTPFFLLSTLSLNFQLISKKNSINSGNLCPQPIRKIECIDHRFHFLKNLRKKLKPNSIGNQVQTLVKYFESLTLNNTLILKLKKNIFKNNFKNKKMVGTLIKQQLKGSLFFPINNEFSQKKNKHEHKFKNIFIKKLKKTKEVFIFLQKKSICKRKNEHILNLILTFPIKTTLDLIRF